MNKNNSLISLAMLKVNIDQKKQGYLSYLIPFILHVLVEHKPQKITDIIVRDFIRDEFGLIIPPRSVQLVLQKMVKQKYLVKEHGIFKLGSKEIKTEHDFHSKITETERRIKSVINSLVDYSHKTQCPLNSEDEAYDAIIKYLSHFSIDCIKNFFRGTSLPDVRKVKNKYIVLVNKYLNYISENDQKIFENFITLVKGQMMANALICPDLEGSPRKFKKTKFYLDTPLVLRLLGLEGEEKRDSINELLKAVKMMEGRFCLFSHTLDEVRSVIKGVERYIDSPKGRGAIIEEMRAQNQKKSDLLLILGNLDNTLREIGLEIIDTPRYVNPLQIDETQFEESLKEEIQYYHNPKAINYDINSVRSIYVLREGQRPAVLENSIATLVTSNSAFSKAAFSFGKEHESSREVSTVITNFSLVNITWLKQPLAMPDLPIKEILAYSYVALNPSESLWHCFLEEIDSLNKKGEISERDHQILRYHSTVRNELMDLTLGEEDALTDESIKKMLSRMTSEISAEKDQEISAERESHLNEVKKHTKTKNQLLQLEKKEAERKKIIYNESEMEAKRYARIISIIFTLGLICIFVINFNLNHNNIFKSITSWILGFLTFINLITGLCVKKIYDTIRNKRFDILYKKKLKKWDLSEE